MEQPGNIYLQRINGVIDHIREHLAEDLSLDALAELACFSPFHFHRIFTSLVGEPVNQFVVRLRLERAAALLKTSPKMPIMDVALECGFESASGFSRAFKKRFGISARSWDRVSMLKDSKNGQILEGFHRYSIESLSYIAADNPFEVRLRELPVQQLAYIRVGNSYEGYGVAEAYERLIAWYGRQGKDWRQATLYGMSQDDPEITPLELCRYDICLDVSGQRVMPAGEISIRVFPACHIAYIHCQGDIYQVDRAWQYLYRYWLPRSRFQPDNLPAMEIYRRQPAELGWEEYDIECAVAVVAL
ncbi:MAG: AraC family transcriptional regulator [Anaerolineae bacterium]|nr:AraC family transcriptional regulator [Anaerolineae bacterium]